MTIRIKLCGLTRPVDAETAIELGADALGFVLESRSPRFVGDDPRWIGQLPPFPIKVAVFGRVNRSVPRGLFDVVQGAEWENLAQPAPKRIHAIRLRPGQTAQDFGDLTIHAGAVMLDAYREGIYGGTGHRVDWDLAAQIVAASRLPVILAGGLSPDNVAEAIRRVRPYAVDVSSGIEASPGVKDPVKMRDFVEAVRGLELGS